MSNKSIYLGGLLSLILVACGTANEPHYADTEQLERPPILASDGQVEPEAQAVDESVVSEKEADVNKFGMGERVYISESTPPVLHIKQPIEGAWNTVGQALKQKELKITDFEKDKHLFYVAYDKRGFFDKVGGYFSSEEKDPVYQLQLAEDGEETTVTAALANQTEQDASDSKKKVENPSDSSAELLQTLYLTMRDELTRVGTRRIRTESSRHSR